MYRCILVMRAASVKSRERKHYGKNANAMDESPNLPYLGK